MPSQTRVLRDVIRAAADELRAPGGLEALPDRLVSMASKFVGSEMTVWGHRTPEQAHQIRWHPQKLDLPKLDESYESLVHEHPVREHFRATGETGPIRLSDHVSLPKFKSSGLYRDYFRHFGVTRLAAVYVPLGNNAHVSLGVSRGGADFSERELSVLAEFRPLLAEGCRLVLRAERAERWLEASEDVLAVLGKGMVLVRSDGLVERVTEIAARSLASMGVEVSENAPVPQKLRTLARSPIGDAVSVQRIPRSAGEIFIVADVVSENPVALFSSFGLTPRECTVLHWLAEGKTNGEIAVVIGAAIGTVRKHLEHIFEKLEVENRAAAVRRAVEIRSGYTAFGVFRPKA